MRFKSLIEIIKDYSSLAVYGCLYGAYRLYEITTKRGARPQKDSLRIVDSFDEASFFDTSRGIDIKQHYAPQSYTDTLEGTMLLLAIECAKDRENRVHKEK